jgi:hypothetical protein
MKSAKNRSANPAVPSSLEIVAQLGIPLDEAKRYTIALIHTDGDAETTKEAYAVDQRITALANASGRPVDEALALEALAGLQQGTSTQSTMSKYVQPARDIEAGAAEIARSSADNGVAGVQTAKAYLAVPNEMVTVARLGRGTRAQFKHLHAEVQQAASVLETGGMYSHHDDPPRPWVRHGVEIVVASCEALLVTRRLANASWASPSTMMLFLTLSVVLYLFVHFLTHYLGSAIAEHRELRSAAHDLTAIATDDGGAS